MSTSQQNPDPRKIEAYLDGTMSDDTRAEFLRELESNRELRADVELQQGIDRALQRRFQAPAQSAALVARLRAARPTPADVVPLRRSRRVGILAAVAAVLVWGGLGWFFLAPLLMQEKPATPHPLTLAQLYQQAVEQGFQPAWVCKDDHEFAMTFLQRQGQGMVLTPMPEGTKMVGLAYYGGVTPNSTTMLARVDDKPIMVFVDRLTANPQPESPDATSGLHLFRKEMGPLVLHELTPLDAPHVMDYLQAADVPPES